MSSTATSRTAETRQLPMSGGRGLGYVLLASGVAGFLAAFDLAIEKFRLLTNPFYVPSCSVNEVISCGSVMSSDQAELFGFPNPLIGIAGFAILLATSGVLLTGGTIKKPYWIGLQVGLTAALLLVFWLIFQTLYRIGAICPYCSVVWVATIAAFWYVSLHNSQYARRGWWSKPTDFMVRNHGVLLTLWLLAIAAISYERFWAPWNSIFV